MRFLTLCAISMAAFAATNANAAVLTENFDSTPYSAWESNWFGANSNAYNYYVSESRNPTELEHNHKGGPDVGGLWLSDGDAWWNNWDYGLLRIDFTEAFGASLTSFSMDLTTALPNGISLVFFDIDGIDIQSFTIPGSPTSVYWTPVGYTNVSVSSTNGIGGFRFIGNAQGNTIIDNLVATTAAVPEPATWAMMLIGFGAIGTAMRQRKAATVSFA
jgi:hypothetical protein